MHYRRRYRNADRIEGREGGEKREWSRTEIRGEARRFGGGGTLLPATSVGEYVRVRKVAGRVGGNKEETRGF